MKNLIGKSCKITIENNDRKSFYTVNNVKDVTDSHITFIDKYNDILIFRISDIKEVYDIK